MEYEYKKEMHIIGTRLKAYVKREKIQDFINKSLKKNQGKQTPTTKDLIESTKPKVLSVQITHKELDFEKPGDSDFFMEPGITIRETSIDTGKTIKEFTMSFDEAKKLSQILNSLE